ncbi:hypothetical protein H0A36_25930 [Endozoicomonas sp. SM1973]|uniref:Inorganic pyrophosphatase domain-containing protein n=1 Tax=Spartinivicinus marinus TaxID=2994442 RepID=A0A853I6B8_9GAMM|nr:hypothetical protein [Spartinivicinus marinus]MCX4030381.1 hypothetical protein [Spartinivicinus marinus]MCX4030451.1 hypothetical protein [Spartinivicinus marinus]NYZ69460.1 hypothetical protein [Spartinivicinus marinus]
MYRFKIQHYLGDPITITLDAEWEQKATATIEGPDFDSFLVTDYMRHHGYTPFGKTAEFPRLAPMDIHCTYSTSPEFEFELLEGDLLPYPPSPGLSKDSLPPAEYYDHLFPAYKQKIQFKSFEVYITQQPGDILQGYTDSGEPWQRKVTHSLGYMRDTSQSVSLDIIVGHQMESERVFMAKPPGEYPVYLLGFSDKAEATRIFHHHYPSDDQTPLYKLSEDSFATMLDFIGSDNDEVID